MQYYNPGNKKCDAFSPLWARRLLRRLVLRVGSLRCGDDGSERSRGKLPNPPKPACWHTPSTTPTGRGALPPDADVTPVFSAGFVKRLSPSDRNMSPTGSSLNVCKTVTKALGCTPAFVNIKRRESARPQKSRGVCDTPLPNVGQVQSSSPKPLAQKTSLVPVAVAIPVMVAVSIVTTAVVTVMIAIAAMPIGPTVVSVVVSIASAPAVAVRVAIPTTGPPPVTPIVAVVAVAAISANCGDAVHLSALVVGLRAIGAMVVNDLPQLVLFNLPSPCRTILRFRCGGPAERQNRAQREAR
jgi:hypothetical protein